MSKLEIETKKCINDYYNKQISLLEEKEYEFTKNFEKEKIKEFENDDTTKEIRKLFDKLKAKFPNLSITTECKIYRYDSDFLYYKENEYKNLAKEIERLKLEKIKLILTLETNTKSSKKYKNAIDNFMELMETTKN